MANLEHIKIVPSTRETAVDVRHDSVDDGEHRAVSARSNAGRVGGIIARAKIVWASKRIINISENAPRVTNGRSPLNCFDTCKLHEICNISI